MDYHDTINELRCFCAKWMRMDFSTVVCASGRRASLVVAHLIPFECIKQNGNQYKKALCTDIGMLIAQFS